MQATIVITSSEELDSALAVLGDLKNAETKANAELDQALTKVRDEHAGKFKVELLSGELVPIEDVQKQLVTQIETYCNKHRKKLLTGEKKSVDLNHGVIGWRKAKDAVIDLPMTDDDKAKGLLHKCLSVMLAYLGTLTLKLGKLPISSLVSVKVTWCKGDILKAFDAKQVTAAALAKQGLEVTRGRDEFYCEPKSEKRAS